MGVSEEGFALHCVMVERDTCMPGSGDRESSRCHEETNATITKIMGIPA